MKNLYRQDFELRLESLSFDDVGGWVDFKDAKEIANISVALFKAKNKQAEAKYVLPSSTPPPPPPPPLPRPRPKPKTTIKTKPTPASKAKLPTRRVAPITKTTPKAKAKPTTTTTATKDKTSPSPPIQPKPARAVHFGNDDYHSESWWSSEPTNLKRATPHPKKPLANVPLVKDVLTDLIPPDVEQLGIWMDRLLPDTPENDDASSDSVSCYSSDCSFSTAYENDAENPNSERKLLEALSVKPGLKLDLSEVGPLPREAIASLPKKPIFKCSRRNCGFVTTNSIYIRMHSCIDY